MLSCNKYIIFVNKYLKLKMYTNKIIHITKETNPGNVSFTILHIYPKVFKYVKFIVRIQYQWSIPNILVIIVFLLFYIVYFVKYEVVAEES